MSRIFDVVRTAVLVLAPIFLGSAGARTAMAADAPRAECENLASVKVANTALKATYIATRDDFVAIFAQAEDGRPPSETIAGTAALPFCRVEATITPVAGADIKSEVWLPSAQSWNKRFLGAGNGGAAGSLNRNVLAAGVAQGYAIAHSDAGSHSLDKVGPNGTVIGMRFGGVNHEWAVNYAYRGYHLTTVVAKALVQSYYRSQPKAALFMGCSGGGYEAMGEAQRYPDDYDGIIAGDPAINFDKLGLWQGMSYIATHRNPAAVIPAEKLPAINRMAVNKCDAIDGVTDQVIDDPRKCKVDFNAMLCTAGDTSECLTPPQVEALTKIYAPLYHPRTRELIYPGFPVGGELAAGARARIVGESTGSTITADTPGPLSWSLPKNFSPKDWFLFDFDKDAAAAMRAFAPYANSNPDLKAFRQKKGKFIVFTGWADPNLYPLDTINYFEAVAKTLGASATQEFARLFVVPGMNHCGGGPGTNVFGQNVEAPVGGVKADPSNNILLALDRWVVDGIPPEEITATKYVDDNRAKGVIRTRPVCAYPKAARWNGKGSTDEARNFSCVAP